MPSIAYQIAEVDRNLSLLRSKWLAACGDSAKRSYLDLIDSALDRRLELMALRDAT